MPDFRDSVGRIDPQKCLQFTRRAMLTNRENGTASDDVMEIVESIVPPLADELMLVRQEEEDRGAEAVVNTYKDDQLKKLLRVLEQMTIEVQDQKVLFKLSLAANTDPVIINAEVPMTDWMKLPELQSCVSRLNETINP